MVLPLSCARLHSNCASAAHPKTFTTSRYLSRWHNLLWNVRCTAANITDAFELKGLLYNFAQLQQDVACLNRYDSRLDGSNGYRPGTHCMLQLPFWCLEVMASAVFGMLQLGLLVRPSPFPAYKSLAENLQDIQSGVLWFACRRRFRKKSF
jgi:hypothetical protein